MSIEHSPAHHIPYHFVAFDEKGNERTGITGLASTELAEAVDQNKPTDIFVFSHGWDAAPRDAMNQYGRWVDAMAARDVDRARLRDRNGGFRPLLVGLHWPSKPWADEDLSGLSYDVEPAQADSLSNGVTGRPQAVQNQKAPTRQAEDEYLVRLGVDESAREAVRTILAAALDDTAPPTLPPEVTRAYEVLNATLAFGAAGEGAAPGDDREPFDAEETYQAALLLDIVDAVSFGGPSLGGLLAPLRVLSFWAMKRRALAFGEGGAAGLLETLGSTAASSTRFHVAGHSFGCIVACAAVSRAGGPIAKRRAVSSLVLLQGAMSHWSFSEDIPPRPGRSGHFHRLVRDGLVSGPVLISTSVHDRALRAFYPLGAGARDQIDYDPKLPLYGALGIFGANGIEAPVTEARMEDIDDTYNFHPETIYNLNADSVIAHNSGAQGAHSDIARPEVARAIWRAVEGR